MAESPDPTPVEPKVHGRDEWLPCPECDGEPIEPKGRQTPKAALGYHRRTEHGVKGEHARDREPKPRAERPAPAKDERAALAVVSGTIGETGGRGVPTVDQLTKTFAKLYGYGAFGAWSLVVDGDPGLPNDQARDAALDMLAPTDEQALATVRPLARLTAGSSLNKRFGRSLVDNSDLIDCLGAIFEQARAARVYFSSRRIMAEAIARGEAPVPATPSPVAGTGPVAPAAPAPGPGPTANENWGTLVTPAMLGRTDLEGPQ